MVAIVGITASAAFAAEPAAATVFGPGETIGRFKVIGGHFRQQVQYLANYRLTDVGATEGDCYVFHYGDKGSAKHDLKFVRGEVSRWRFGDLPVIETGSEDLEVKGTTSRTFSSDEKTQTGPGFDEDCDPPDPPLDTSPGCGTKSVANKTSGLALLAWRRGHISPDAASAILWGPVFDFGEDPINGCSSTSVFALVALDAPSRHALKKLDRVKPGEKLTLDGERRVTYNNKTGFIWPFGNWVSGTQTVHVDWALEVKRVAKHR